MAKFNESRAYGVEIEIRGFQIRRDGIQYPIGRNQIARWLNNINGIDCQSRDYTHDTTSYWKVVSDATCGWEIVSPKLYGHDGLDQIRKVVNKLKAHGAVIDSRCGLHVHHDAADLTPNAFVSVGMIYQRLQSSIDNLFIKRERLSNPFCRPIRIGLLTHLKKYAAQGFTNRQSVSEAGYRYGRYYTVNYLSFLRHGSIEFRQSHATLNYEELNAWVVFTQLIVNKAKDVDDASAGSFVNTRSPASRGFYRHTNPLKTIRNDFPNGGMDWLGRPLQEPKKMYLHAVNWLLGAGAEENVRPNSDDCHYERHSIDLLVQARDFEAMELSLQQSSG